MSGDCSGFETGVAKARGAADAQAKTERTILKSDILGYAVRQSVWSPKKTLQDIVESESQKSNMWWTPGRR